MPIDLASHDPTLRITNRHGEVLPFSRGIMATSLLATGLRTEEAYRLASIVQESLHDGRARHDSDELVEVACDVLRSQPEGEQIVRRWLSWRAVRRSGRPVVIVLGGRRDCWEGRISVEQTWARLFPGDAPDVLDDGLARTYARGPILDRVRESDQRAWLLSNHRSEWLLPQLRRFGLERRFEQILVSDDIGVAKPDGDAFRIVRRRAGPGRVVLFDDSARNVAAASRAGLEAYRVIAPDRSNPVAAAGRLG